MSNAIVLCKNSPRRIAAPVCVCLLLWVCLGAPGPAAAQNVASEVPYYSRGSGIGISSQDSLFLLNIRFRLQSRVGYETETDRNLRLERLRTRLERLRLRLDGFFYKPELTYVIQLGFSDSDMNVNPGAPSPSIVKDAVIFYRFNRNLSLGLGLTNLPRNRQAVISSGDLELVDRSPLTSVFGVQRDYGLQVYYYNSTGGVYYALRGAVTAGEGDNAVNSEKGLSYTARAELLPLGTFSGKGDYFEGDLEREEKPKVSLGLTYNLNRSTTGTGGGSAEPLHEPRDIAAFMADFLLKFRGLSVSVEHLTNDTRKSPVTAGEDGAESYAWVGSGQNFQLGYVFPSNWGVAIRHARLSPDTRLSSKAQEYREVTLGASRYIKGHRLKMQADLSRRQERAVPPGAGSGGFFLMRVQLEVGL